MLPRVLEPEVMDSLEDAVEYDAMDHTVVIAAFVADLLAALNDWSLQRPVTSSTTLRTLDLGAGTAQIPIELARRTPAIHITAVDAAKNMLALAEKNVSAAGLSDRITLLLADAKQLPFDSGAFDVVISNSILHHIPGPEVVICEAVRVTAPGGFLFHRDLARPNDENAVLELVASYAADATSYQRSLFAESLHAALTVDEVSNLVAHFSFDRESVHMSSDRHWTWTAAKAERH
jgi:SAM-dependent methyltransferase